MTGNAENRPRVLVVDYDPSWPDKFEELRQAVWSVVHDVALSIEHVGSTAVPGLAAKPIIDMDVVVPSRGLVAAAIVRLGALGYAHRGNLGIEDREAFTSPARLPAHNLYVCLQGTVAVANHVAFRDFLRRNPESAAEYGRLKQELAARFPADIDSYIAGKTACILAILRQCGFTEPALQIIEDANRPASDR